MNKKFRQNIDVKTQDWATPSCGDTKGKKCTSFTTTTSELHI